MSRTGIAVLFLSGALLLAATLGTLQFPARRDLPDLVFVLSLAVWWIAPAVIVVLSPLRLLPLSTILVLLCLWAPADNFLGLIIGIWITMALGVVLVARLAFAVALRMRRGWK